MVEQNPSFFAFHGWLSPGVRLFRRISFPAKSLWLATAFLIPLAFMLAQIWSVGVRDIASTERERQGLEYTRPVLTLVRLAQEYRLNVAAGKPQAAAIKDKLQQEFATVERFQATLGKEFQLAQAFQQLATQHQAVMAAASGTVDENFALHTQYIAAALEFVREIVDGSDLRLDPERDTYHMMNMALLSGPQQYENTARMRGLGVLILSSQNMTQGRRDRMLEWNAVQKYLDKDVENSYQEGVARFPEVAALFDMKGTDEASDAFAKAIDQQILGKSLAGDADTYVRLGNAAVDRQIDLAAKVADRLDMRLLERIEQLQRTLYLQTGVSLVFVLLAAYLLLSFYRVMLGGLNAVSTHLQAITSGNLTLAPEPWGRDETAQLMLTMADMQTSLRRIVSVVLTSSAEVQGGSGEIASASRNLSKQTAVAATSLEHAAQTMGLINAQVEQTTQTMTGAMAIVRENADVAVRGGQVVREVVVTMEEISHSSQRIGEIISVIDGIAFQTNLLALNAAVEAARAGEQGRGFAVVASEVRALAGRSALAAKEIKDLVAQSIAKVESGNAVVAQAGTTIGEIVTNADKISGMMEQISLATKEQSAGMQKIESTVQELDQATQRNAAQAERTTTSATVLAEQALHLVEEVSFFRIDA